MTSRILLTAWTLAALAACGSSKSSGTSSSGTTATSTTSTGASTTGSSTTGDMTVNGCTKAMAADKTAVGMTFEVSSIQPWALTHQACVRVKVGTTVSWKGDFATHPLSGGPVGMPDAASPITVAAKTVTGMGTVSAKLDNAGAYPYYCTIHLASMQGVVYAE